MKKRETAATPVQNSDDSFTTSLISSINKAMGRPTAYNLESHDSPTHVKRYIGTGSVLLNYIISNRHDGGVAEGRLIEVCGQESTGKTLIALQILACTQKAGGVAIYLDTENATDVELLRSLGIDTNKLVYLQPKYVEEVFEIIEHIIKKIKETDNDKPITIVWDSVAATPPKTELDGTYEQNTVGLGARAVSKGLRKITQFIGDNRITLVFLNQLKMKIGASLYEDPWITPYGKAIPYHASTRIQLTRKKSSDIKDDADDIAGVGVKAKIIKNKISPPFRTCEFTIQFYRGIVEHEQLFKKLIESSPIDLALESGDFTLVAKGGAWHSLLITSSEGNEIFNQKFRKSEIENKIMKNEDLISYLDCAINAVLKKHYSKQDFPEFPDINVDDLHR